MGHNWPMGGSISGLCCVWGSTCCTWESTLRCKIAVTLQAEPSATPGLAESMLSESTFISEGRDQYEWHGAIYCTSAVGRTGARLGLVAWGPDPGGDVT
eukprot:354423-Chlamydomonas_euryale.AAC.16